MENCSHCNRKDETCGCRNINQGDKMKKRNFYKTTPLGKEESDISKKSILIEYPDEDLFEDGELSDDMAIRPVGMPITEVEDKIIKLWRQGKIVIAKWEELK